MGLVVDPLLAPGPTLNRGVNSGRPDVGSGAAAPGMMLGVALRGLMSMLWAPMRNWPVPNAALVRSIVKPVAVSVANGAAVPVPVQVTASVAGNLGRASTLCARETRGAEAKGLTYPSIPKGTAAAALGRVHTPVLTT